MPIPIPELNSDGLLPSGIFDCALADVKSRFGVSHLSDRRPVLFARLQEMVTIMKASGLFSAVIIDGSFITDKPAPNDIDLLAILRLGQKLGARSSHV